MEIPRIATEQANRNLRVTVGPSRRPEDWRRGAVAIAIVVGAGLLGSMTDRNSRMHFAIRLGCILAAFFSVFDIRRVVLLLFSSELVELDSQNLVATFRLFGFSWRSKIPLARIVAVKSEAYRLPGRRTVKTHFSVVIRSDARVLKLGRELSKADADALAAHVSAFVKLAPSVAPYR